jgi:hypothetical protein
LKSGIEDLQKLLKTAGFNQIVQSDETVLLIGFVRAIK